MQLPAGLTPVQAGRFGLWLLGRRSYRAARRRRALPRRAWKGTLVGRFCALVAPWHTYEYPGPTRFLAEFLRVSKATAHNYMKPSVELPVCHALPLAEHLEGHAAECVALAAELRVYARDRTPLAKRKIMSKTG